METFMFYYLIFFITFLIIISIQNFLEELIKKRKYQNFLKSKLQHINCPRCITSWKKYNIELIGQYKIYLSCPKCGHKWHTTFK